MVFWGGERSSMIIEGAGESHNYCGNDWRVGGLADRG
jgi:hypothetical protein